MLDLQPTFRPIRRLAGYLPLEDLGLIGDGATAALVGLDGSIQWLCVPGFDDEPLFCGLLDHAKGGQFTLTPEGLLEARQQYEPDTGVLITELRTSTGLVRITDALALYASLLRGPARSACYPSRSTRRRASLPATSRRRSVTSE